MTTGFMGNGILTDLRELVTTKAALIALHNPATAHYFFVKIGHQNKLHVQNKILCKAADLN